jgi:multidrug efflux pump
VLFDGVAGGFDWLISEYERGLDWVLSHQAITLFIAGLTLAVTCLQYVEIPKGFFPEQDTGAVLGITSAPQDISFKAMSERQQALAAAVLADPDVVSLSSFIGVDGTNMSLNNGRLQISLKPRDERADSVGAVIERLKRETQKVYGISVALQPVPDLTVDSTVGQAQYHFILENPDASQFAQWTPKLVDRLSQNRDFEEVSSDLTQSGRQLALTVDRQTAARFGVTVASVKTPS